MSLSPFRTLLQALVLFVCIGLSACCTDAYITSSCGVRPAGGVDGFDLTFRTGSDGTDANIFFCYSLIDSPMVGEECFLLDSSADNFEAGLTDTFTITTSFAAESFDTFWIENRGGGFLGESGWDIDAIDVYMRSGTESTLLYSESNIVCNESVSGDESYMPGGCVWD